MHSVTLEAEISRGLGSRSSHRLKSGGKASGSRDRKKKVAEGENGDRGSQKKPTSHNSHSPAEAPRTVPRAGQPEPVRPRPLNQERDKRGDDVTGPHPAQNCEMPNSFVCTLKGLQKFSPKLGVQGSGHS